MRSLGSAVLALALVSFSPAPRSAEPGVERRLADLEKSSGGRLGVAVLDTAGRERIDHRAQERFPMCSTFKLLAVADVLTRVERGAERLDRRIPFGKEDLLEYAPITRARVGEGGMSLNDLSAAAITVSDNTAANLILSTLGGPAGFNAYVRSLGDHITRLDRNEPTLNEALPGDVRDTTSPAAMLADLERLLAGNALSRASREKLIAWLAANTTGNAFLRAGLPAGWRLGDKTGTCGRGSTNDVAIVWPPGRRPILIAVFLTETSIGQDARSEVLAKVARILWR